MAFFFHKLRAPLFGTGGSIAQNKTNVNTKLSKIDKFFSNKETERRGKKERSKKCALGIFAKALAIVKL